MYRMIYAGSPAFLGLGLEGGHVQNFRASTVLFGRFCKLGVLVVCVLTMRTLQSGVHIRPLDIRPLDSWKLAFRVRESLREQYVGWGECLRQTSILARGYQKTREPLGFRLGLRGSSGCDFCALDDEHSANLTS